MYILGTSNSELARVATHYFNHIPNRAYSPYGSSRIKYTAEKEFITDLSSRDVSEVLEKESQDRQIFIPIGYKNLNKDRERLTETFQSRGWSILSHVAVDSQIHNDVDITSPKGLWIQEDCRLQTGCVLGDGCIVWAGGHLGHLSKVGKFCWITSGAILCSSCVIEDYVFIGANSVIGPEVTIGIGSIVSSLANVTKSVPPYSIIGAGHNNILSKNSREIIMK